MKLPIGIQLYSVRNDMEKDFEGTLNKIKAMGYDGVEFAGVFGRSAKNVKSLLDEIGLKPVSAHIPFDDMMNDTEDVLTLYKEIGCEYVVIPYMTEEYRPGAEKFADLLEGIKKIGKVANEKGMTLLYHNHDFEFVKINGEYGLDVLYNSIDEDLLKTEIDTCWVNVGGENPSDYVIKYSGRAPVVHLKDFEMTGNAKNLYKLIGIDEEEKEEDEGKFEFRPIGYGKQDFKSILNASEKAGAKWVVVEQDEPSMDKTPLECAKMSIEYLKEIL